MPKNGLERAAGGAKARDMTNAYGEGKGHFYVDLQMVFRTGDKDMWEDKTVIVGTIKESVNTGYSQGFVEGYQAACLVIEVLAEASRNEPCAYDLEGAVMALDMSREKAVEMMGTPRFEVAPVHVHPSTTTIN